MRALLSLAALSLCLAAAASGCVVETTTGCTATSCGAGYSCGVDGLCHPLSTCATTGCPSGQTCGTDGICHVATTGAGSYASCSASPGCADATQSCVNVVTAATTGGSFCSRVGCTSTADCVAGAPGLGSACLMLASAPGSPFVCYPGCSTDLDCLPGTSCIPVTGGAVGSVCMPGAPLLPDYAHCDTSSQCASGTCAMITAPTTTGGTISGRMCTKNCGASSECTGFGTTLGAGCFMLAGTASDFFCYPGCNTAADCVDGETCYPVTGGAVGQVCFPTH